MGLQRWSPFFYLFLKITEYVFGVPDIRLYICNIEKREGYSSDHQKGSKMNTFEFENETLSGAVEKMRDLRQRQVDVVAPIHSLKMLPTGEVILEGVENVPGGNLMFTRSEVADEQIAAKLKIPRKYWERMVQQRPTLAAENFNHWIQQELETKGEEKTRRVFLRSYLQEAGGNMGKLRAMLSDRYMPIDTLSMLAAAVKACAEAQERGVKLVVDRCDLSEKGFYARFVAPDIRTEAREALMNFEDPNGGAFGGVGRDYGVTTGFILRNSELGHGQAEILPLCYIRACNNNMIWRNEGFQRKHLGAKMEEAYYQKDTLEANMDTVLKQIRDNVNHFLSPDYLGKFVKEIEEMAAIRISEPKAFFAGMGREMRLSDSEQEGIFDAFLKSGSTRTVFDAAQAVTSYAHHVNPDRRFELESQVFDMKEIALKIQGQN